MTRTQIIVRGKATVDQFIAAYGHLAPELTKADRAGRYLGVVHDSGALLIPVQGKDGGK